MTIETKPANPDIVRHILLNRHVKTRYELDQKLLEKGYSGAEIEAAWAEVLAGSEGYVPPEPIATNIVALPIKSAIAMLLSPWLVLACWQWLPLPFFGVLLVLAIWLVATINTYRAYRRRGLMLHFALILLTIFFILQSLANTNSDYIHGYRSDALAATVGGVGVDTSGKIYTFERGTKSKTINNPLNIYSSDGKLLTRWQDTPGFNKNSYFIADIAFDSKGYVYLANFEDKRVEKYDQSGNLQRTWADNGTLEYKLPDKASAYYPQRLAIDSQDNLYVLFESAIRKYNSNGQLLNEIPSGGGNGQLFFKPQAITVDKADNLYVYDPYGVRIVQKYNAAGQVQQIWRDRTGGVEIYGNSALTRMSVNSKGTVYLLLGGDEPEIFEFDSNLRETAHRYLLNYGSRYKIASGLAIDAADNVYITQVADNVLDGYTTRVMKLDRSGKLVQHWQVTDTLPWGWLMWATILAAIALMIKYIITTVTNRRAATIL